MIKYESNSSYKSTPIYGRNNHKELQTQNLIILVWRRGREWVCLQEIILVEFFNLSADICCSFPGWRSPDFWIYKENSIIPCAVYRKTFGCGPQGIYSYRFVSDSFFSLFSIVSSCFSKFSFFSFSVVFNWFS